MDIGKFDEFGNKAPNEDSSSHDDFSSTEEEAVLQPANPATAPTAGWFGDDVEVVVGQEPTQSIRQPLVAPNVSPPAAVQTLLLTAPEQQQPADFIGLLGGIPERQRCVTLVGALHHGKTSLCSVLTGSPAPKEDMHISYKADVRTSVVSGNLSQASILLTTVDTPGHPEFFDECACAMRLVDAAIICVDCAEGVLRHTITLIQRACNERLAVILCITKLDRLIVELRIPPADAYEKLKAIVRAVNNVLLSCNTAPVSPVAGSVWFSSSKLGIFFTLEQFARAYCEAKSLSCASQTLASRFWGPVAFDKKQKKFVPHAFGMPYSFVSFLLDPIYKAVAFGVAGELEALQVQRTDNCQSPIDVASDSLKQIFGDPHEAAVDAIVHSVPNSISRNNELCTKYVGANNTKFAAIAPLVRIVSPNSEVLAVCRVVRGVLKLDESVSVVTGPSSYPTAKMKSMGLITPQGMMAVKEARAGQIVVVGGISTSVGKHTLLVPEIVEDEDAPFVAPLTLPTPHLRVAVDTVSNAHSAQLSDVIRTIDLTFPGAIVTVEESGERIIQGFGEVYMNVLFYVLRTQLLSPYDTPLRISPPFVSFSETVEDKSGALSSALVGDSQVGFTANSLEQGLAEEFEQGSLPHSRAERDRCLTEKYGWDLLHCKGYTALGPEKVGPNVFVSDVLEDDLHPLVLESCVAGFRWALRQGPLCGEPIRGTRFMLIEALLQGKGDNWEVPSKQRIVTNRMADNFVAATRRAIHETVLASNPRLMEPVLHVEILTPVTRMDAIQALLRARRGAVTREAPCPGTPLCIVEGLVPAMDALGLETEMRMRTAGEAFPTFSFDHWALVPGSPLDDSVQLPLLQAAQGVELARDFVLKTRRRKGLAAL